ncbi:MAG: FAD:protein FMN transferase [Planctomycetota bacterium]
MTHPSSIVAKGLALVVLAAPLFARSSERVERRVAAMGTLLVLDVGAPTRAEALRASEAAVRALARVEQRLSTWSSESELARLNAARVGEAFALSPELAAELARARELWRATGGAFDPGVGALVRAWGLREGGRKPSPDELAGAFAAGGFGALELGDGTATRLRAGLVLEEGGFGKGVGLDAALAALRDAGATDAVLDLGGQLAVLPGGGDQETAFAVAHPRARAQAVVELRIGGGSLATSGNSERAIEVNGERRSHLIDPRTGEPAADFGSVTVWARDATTADALSTALFVLGPDAGLEWAAAHAGVEALYLVDADDGGLLAAGTAGLAGRAFALAEGLTLELAPAPELRSPPAPPAEAETPHGGGLAFGSTSCWMPPCTSPR